jgi:hypothetical protein
VDFNVAMQQIADRLDTIAGLRCFGYDAPTLVPPAATVSYPDELDPHGTYNNGMARMKLQVMIVVGVPTARSTRDLLAVWANDGPDGVVAVLESGVDAGAYTAFHEITVTNISFDPVELASVTYAAVFFDLDVVGAGV